MSNELERNFSDTTLKLLKELDPGELDLKSLCRLTRSTLTILRRAKSYLRENPDLKTWVEIKEQCLENLIELSSGLSASLGNIELLPQDLVAVLEVSGAGASALYEERIADTNTSNTDEPPPILTLERLRAMQSVTA